MMMLTIICSYLSEGSFFSLFIYAYLFLLYDEKIIGMLRKKCENKLETQPKFQQKHGLKTLI